MQHVSKLTIVAALLAAMICSASRALAEDKPDKTASGRRTAEKPVVTESSDTDKPRHRLPSHYAGIVDEKQREKIYGIQDAYAERIEKLQAQLDEVTAKRDNEIRDVLTAAQKKQLDALIAEANAKRQKTATEKDGAKGGDEMTDAKGMKAGSDKSSSDTKTKKTKQ